MPVKGIAPSLSPLRIYRPLKPVSTSIWENHRFRNSLWDNGYVRQLTESGARLTVRPNVIETQIVEDDPLRFTVRRAATRKYARNQVHRIRNIHAAIAVGVTLPLRIIAEPRGCAAGKDVRNQKDHVGNVN
jgi:hypothetical protein